MNRKITVIGAGAVGSSIGYLLVAENVELEEEEEVVELTITLADVEIVNNITEVDYDGKGSLNVADAGTKGAVVKFTINVANAAETDAIAGMAWVFEVKNDETQATATKYAAADATIVAALNSGILSGSVEIAAALNSTGYTITGAKALLSVAGESVELTG